jgi:hypothetical protein
MGWLLFFGYVIAAGVCSGIWYEVYGDEDDSDDRIAAGFVGLIWPVTLGIAVPAWLGAWIVRMYKTLKNNTK